MILSVTESQREILAMLVKQEYARKQASAEGVELTDYEVEYLADLHTLRGIVEYGNFEWTSPLMFAAAAAEIEQITVGLVAHKTPITTQLAGHWAGRILGAAFRADGNRPHEREPAGVLEVAPLRVRGRKPLRNLSPNRTGGPS